MKEPQGVQRFLVEYQVFRRQTSIRPAGGIRIFQRVCWQWDARHPRDGSGVFTEAFRHIMAFLKPRRAAFVLQRISFRLIRRLASTIEILRRLPFLSEAHAPDSIFPSALARGFCPRSAEFAILCDPGFAALISVPR